MPKKEYFVKKIANILIICIFLCSQVSPAYATGFTWGSSYAGDAPDASEIATDVTNFDTNLSSTDTTVQAALETLDELVTGAGSGSVTTIKEATVQLGGADIVTLDFGAGFDLTETPDKEINIDLDFTEVSGHDDFTDFVANEHLDWTASVGTIHTDNYIENATHTGEVTGSGALTIADSVTVNSWVMGTFSGTQLTCSTVIIDLLDTTGAADMDYGSADVTDHTFTTDSTGTAEIVLPAGAIDGTEILDDTVDSDDYAATSIDFEHLAPDVISGATTVTPVSTDMLLLWDATDSALKKVDASNFLAGSGDITDVWSVASGDVNQPVIGTGEYLDGGTATSDATGEGIILPRATDVSAATGEGEISWDTDDDKLYIGTGSAVVEIGAGGGGATTDGGAVTYVTSATDDFAIGGTDSSAAFFFDEGEEFATIGTGASGSIDFGTNTIDDDAVGNLLVDYMSLSVQAAKLTGSFVTTAHTGVSAATGAGIDAGDGNWRLLFDATTDEAGVWGFRMPNTYDNGLVAKIQYSMSSATSGTVEFEVSVMAVSDGDSADIGTASFDTVNVGSATVPGTAGYLDEVSITLTNADSVAAGDYVYIYLSTDADDATNDTATGDREVVNLQLEWNRT